MVDVTAVLASDVQEGKVVRAFDNENRVVDAGTAGVGKVVWGRGAVGLEQVVLEVAAACVLDMDVGKAAAVNNDHLDDPGSL